MHGREWAPGGTLQKIGFANIDLLHQSRSFDAIDLNMRNNLVGQEIIDPSICDRLEWDAQANRIYSIRLQQAANELDQPFVFWRRQQVFRRPFGARVRSDCWKPALEFEQLLD